MRPGKVKPPSQPLQPRRTERGEQRRRALLEAAQQVFLEQGYEGASIEEMMRRVGGSKASLYSYFGSKEGLFWEILSALTDEFMKDLSVPEHADADVAQTLRDIGKRFVRVFLDEKRRGIFRIMVAEAQRFPELARRFYERGPQRSRQLLGRYLKLQCEAGRLQIDDADVAAMQFFELVKSQPHMRVLMGLPPFVDGAGLEKHVNAAVQLFLHGYAAPPRPSRTRA